MLLNDIHGAAMVECHDGFFVKEWLPWQHHRPQWHVYMADFWTSAIRR